MARISLDTLGGLRVFIDGAPASGFESDKVRALLVYLAAEAGRPHRRDSLAALLWPERPDKAAQLNLNQALANLRRAIGDREAAAPLLTADRGGVQVGLAADYRLDLAEFHALLDACAAHAHRDPAGCLACAERLEAAAALYAGDFLAGFAPRDCAPFQEWAALQRERAHRRAVEGLDMLAASYERRGDRAAALGATRRLVELDPWNEPAHRSLMLLLWRDGQRAAALAQYERLRSTLEVELGADPDEATEALRLRIQQEDLADAAGARRRPTTCPARRRPSWGATPSSAGWPSCWATRPAGW